MDRKNGDPADHWANQHEPIMELHATLNLSLFSRYQVLLSAPRDFYEPSSPARLEETYVFPFLHPNTLRTANATKMNKFKPTRVRKQKARARAVRNGAVAEPQHDANAVVIDPADQKERMAKKQELRDALRAEQPQMSSKKKKRLDKYIVSHKRPLVVSSDSSNAGHEAAEGGES